MVKIGIIIRTQILVQNIGKKNIPVVVLTTNLLLISRQIKLVFVILLCGLKINYKPSSCNVNNNDNLINILYDAGSYVVYKSENSIKYLLNKLVPHVPSLHTINGTKYDMELCLYHTNSEGKLLIISVLINSNNNFSYSQDFLNQFIPGLKNQNYSGTPNQSI